MLIGLTPPPPPLPPQGFEASRLLGLKQREVEIAKKLRTAQPQVKVTGSYKKKRVILLPKIHRVGALNSFLETFARNSRIE